MLASLVGQADASTNYNGKPYEHKQLTIAVKEIYYKQDKIWSAQHRVRGSRERRVDRAGLLDGKSMQLPSFVAAKG